MPIGLRARGAGNCCVMYLTYSCSINAVCNRRMYRAYKGMRSCWYYLYDIACFFIVIWYYTKRAIGWCRNMFNGLCGLYAARRNLIHVNRNKLSQLLGSNIKLRNAPLYISVCRERAHFQSEPAEMGAKSRSRIVARSDETQGPQSTKYVRAHPL